MFDIDVGSSLEGRKHMVLIDQIVPGDGRLDIICFYPLQCH